MESTSNKGYLWIYFILFYVLWSIRELWLVHYLNLLNPVLGAIMATIVKITVWIIPVLLLVWKFEKKDPFIYLRLKYNFVNGLKWAIWITIAMAVYFMTLSMVANGELNLNLGWDDWLNSVIFVGITEEMVFRGYLLKNFMQSHKFWKANIITSLLFVSIHFPIWASNGLFESPYIVSAMIQVFIISIVFGLIYKRTDSLWSVVIIHSMYDLLVTVFGL